MNLPSHHIVYYRVSFCVVIACITYLATTATDIQVVSASNDKFNHVIAFLALSFLLDFSFPKQRFNSKKIMVLIVYGIALEIIQDHLPHRKFSYLDIAADTLGLFVYGLILPLLKRIELFKPRWS